MESQTKLMQKQWEDYADFVHTGPGTLAGEYLRALFWHPVYRAQDLPPGRAVPIEIMSERFTLYRGEGGLPHVVAFRCAHRGTQLSTGWVEGDNIRCRYHGWMYDGTGQCVERPGEPESFSAKAGIRSYPTQEYLGLIFLYLGQENSPPPIQRHPDFEGPGILDLEEPEYWPCNYFNRVENACDSAHVLYTHYETNRRAGRAVERGMSYYNIPTAEETSYGVRTFSEHEGDRKEGMQFRMPYASRGGAPFGRWGIQHASPESTASRIRFRVPLNDQTTMSFTVNKLKITDEETEAYRKNRERYLDFFSNFSPTEIGKAVLEGRMGVEEVDPSAVHANLHSVEDYVTQVGQGAQDERGPDRLGRIDQGVIAIRKIWERELRAFSEGRPTKRWAVESL